MSNTAGPDVVHPSLRQLQLSANMLENASDRESGGSESDGEGMLNRVKRDFPTDKISSTIPVKTGNNSEDAPVMPIQKRRRVTRACDECRRKKIKCDGKQPCTHCQIYNYECTYNKPSNRRRNPAPQYIEALENRLDRAETLLRQFIPDINLADPHLDSTIQQEFHNRERARATISGEKKKKDNTGSDAQILSMIESLGQLDLDDRGSWDFHGISSGAVFLRKIQEHFPAGMLQTPAYNQPFLPRAQNQPGILKIESPSFTISSPWISGNISSNPLPPRETADRLCYLALNCATCLIRIVHLTTFNKMLDRLYEIPPETYEVKETRFLGLLYAVMALGCLYDVPENSSLATTPTYKVAVKQGHRYYTTARMVLQDITECQDVTTLQALLFIILFLQGTSNLTGCYAFVGIAFRSAISMGFHRRISHPRMSKIDDQVRRRVFYIIRQMDTYVSAILGFPMMNIDDAVDQLYPEEVNDEYIQDNIILQPPPGTPSFMQAFNAHTNLMDILAKIVKHVYPVKGIQETTRTGVPNTTYMISYRRILEIETELHTWLERLPDFWKPSSEREPEVIRVQSLLRFAYAHVQMLLYRPFIHYCSPRLTKGKNFDQRAFHCAASAINISRNIIHIGTEIRKQGVLIGPYWFILYTQLFAILSLVFYVLENPNKAGAYEILADATTGREMIASISKRSYAAEKVSHLLTSVFDKLPENLGKTKGQITLSKKRSAPESKVSIRSSDLDGSVSESGVRDRSTATITMMNLMPEFLSSTNNQRAVPDVVGRDLQSMLLNGGASESSEAKASPIDGQCHPTQQYLPSTQQSQQAQHYDQQHQQQFQHQHPHLAHKNANPVYNDMFSASDPFAYPSQPLLDFTSQEFCQTPSDSNPQMPQKQETSVFNIPANIFDDLEGKFVELPACLWESQSGQSTVDCTSQMYGVTSISGHQDQSYCQNQQAYEVQQGQNVYDFFVERNWTADFLQRPNF